jgi:hypothetical protein
VIPTKARRIQGGNLKELAKLRAAFGSMQIDAIAPRARLMGKRGQQAKARANREKALLSHLFNKAREWGYTDATNPCQGVKGFKESGRDRYVSDDEFRAVWEKADQTTRDAMDLALVTGQRPADVLKIERTDLRDGALWIVQNETKVKRAIEITGELAALIERINARPRERLSAWLIQDDDGKPLGTFGLRSRFDKARTLAGVEFQFRDIRAKAASDTGGLGALAETAGALQPRNDGTLCPSKNRRARCTTPIGHQFMTLVVGITFSHFGGALLSDTRVTFASGPTRDMIRKSYSIGRCMAAGFAGSVAIGFDLVHSLTMNLQLPANASNNVWDPAWVAREWSPIAKAIFDQAPEAEGKHGSSILMVGVDPKGSGARLIRLSAPTFKPQFLRQGVRMCSIGTGSRDRRIMREVRRYVDMRTTPAGLLQGGIALWAGSLADYVGNESGTHLGSDVGRHFHVLTVEARGFSLHASGRESFVDWQDEPINLDPMPAVAESFRQFCQMSEADGFAAAAARC